MPRPVTNAHTVKHKPELTSSFFASSSRPRVLPPAQATEQLALVQRQSTVAGFYSPGASVMDEVARRKKGGRVAGAAGTALAEAGADEDGGKGV